MITQRNKNIKSDIIPAHPNKKISFFKKVQMYVNAKKNLFSVFKLKSQQWRYWMIFLDDIFKYSICGLFISLPIFYLNPFTLALAFGSGLFIYSYKIHTLLVHFYLLLNL